MDGSRSYYYSGAAKLPIRYGVKKFRIFKKLGRCFHFLNDWYGFHQGNGSNQHKQNEKVFNIAQSDEPSTQKELAQSYGITQQTMNNYMRMASMIPELEDLVDTGIVTNTTTLASVRYLSPDLQDEDSKLRALISNNFGRRKNDPTKDRKALATYVELKGNSHDGNRKSKDQNGLLNLDEIAKELNMSKSNLKRALRIERYLTDSMKELLDKGVIIK